jgi:hypothetical protein
MVEIARFGAAPEVEVNRGRVLFPFLADDTSDT